ncbi:MAG: glycosyltransferase family 4 protein [Ginsengibacter sp.]
MSANLLFLTLKVFSETGGIEKVSRIAGKALYELCGEENINLRIYSLHDEPSDANDKYFPAKIFCGFNARRFPFVLKSIRNGIKSNIVLLSHINLLSIGYLIKKLSPKTKIILLAHGIEIWEPLLPPRRIMLLNCDRILAVSRFTKDIIDRNNLLKEGQCIVLNNCLDPFLQETNPGKPVSLLNRYGLGNSSIILMTLSRIFSNERYKGYEKVIRALQQLIPEFPGLKYMIVGKYDAEEKKRLDDIITETGVEQKVIFTGFIPDDELADHYNLADVYIMPSKKEGFGISFIEAMFYGIPVIAGNSDGSADALFNGALGTLINPEDQEEITAAIKKILINKTSFTPDRNLLLQKFSYPTYKNNLEVILQDLQNE